MKNVTAERLREVLHYDPETGLFTWRQSAYNFRGKKAGSLNEDGYVTFQIDRSRYRANRLAWLYMTGEWPTWVIAYRNHDRTDNRWCNLVELSYRDLRAISPVTRSNTSGYKGVSFRECRRKWRAYIRVDGKMLHLGYYTSRKSAHAAYVEAFKKHYSALSEYAEHTK